MKGDFTRMTFRQPRHYRGVRWQQGRVQNEADDNEQVDIVNHRIETETLDTVGASGVPAVGGGFEVGVSGGKLTLSRGRMYVGGLLCELDEDVAIDAQPDLPAMPGHEPEPGRYLVYVDAWVRHVTALEDPYLREKALGGPDTCTRMQTVCQAKLLLLTGDKAYVDHEQFGIADLPELRSTGRMRAGVSVADDEGTPCVLPPKAGYRRLDNQLYRVEIHTGGPVGRATFKWSRDNGTVAFAVVGRTGEALELQDLGPDQERSVDHRHLVELVDDASVLSGRVERLLGVETVPQGTSSITLEGAVPGGFALGDEGLSRHPLVRRWDHVAPEGSADGAIPVVEGEAIALEGGIEIEFEENEHEPRVYRPGDYWLVPARTVTADAEWPRDANDEPSFEAPRSSPRAVAALAVVKCDKNGRWSVKHDCRRRFVAQADHVELDGIGGDGQLALHEAEGGLLLPQPLRVRVRRGGRAWVGARVKFQVGSGDGMVAAREGNAPTRSVTVAADTRGLAEARWTLGSVEPSQRVLVTLEEPGVQEGPPVAFGASYVAALVGRASVELSPAMDWYATLEQLAASKSVRDVAVTFAPGKYQLEGEQRIGFTGKRSVRIAGMGMGTVIASDESAVVLELQGCQYVSVRDLFVDGVEGVAQAEVKEGIRGVLDVRGAFDVEVERVTARTATAATPRLACIAIDGTPMEPTEEDEGAVCEVRVRRCELTPGDEQVGLRIAMCSRVTMEDNVIGHAPHEDRTPVGLELGEKLKDDEYAKRVLKYALWGLREVGEGGLTDGFSRIELGGGKSVEVKPYASIAGKVVTWLEDEKKTSPGLAPDAFIKKVQEDGLMQLQKNQLGESWPKLLRDSILESYRSPVAQTGIEVIGRELGAVSKAARAYMGGGGGFGTAAPEGGGSTGGLAARTRESSGDDVMARATVAFDPEPARPVFRKHTVQTHPRRKAEVRVLGCSISNARRGVVVMPRETEGDGEQLGTVEICGNVVGVDVSVDGIGQDHVGVSVGSTERAVVVRNRVDVVRKAQAETDTVGVEMEGIMVEGEGKLGSRVTVGDNFVGNDGEGE